MPSWKIYSAQLEGRVGRNLNFFERYFEITGGQGRVQGGLKEHKLML